MNRFIRISTTWEAAAQECFRISSPTSYYYYYHHYFFLQERLLEFSSFNKICNSFVAITSGLGMICLAYQRRLLGNRGDIV